MVSYRRTPLSKLRYLILGLSGIPIFSSFLLKNNLQLGYTESEWLQSCWSSIVVLALLIPISIDWLFDSYRKVLDYHSSSDARSDQVPEGLLGLAEMFVVIAGLFVPSASYLTEGYETTNIPARSFRWTLVVGILATAISRIDSHFWPQWMEFVVLFLFVSSQIFRVYCAVFTSTGDDDHAQFFFIIWAVAAILAAISFYSMFFVWIYYRIICPYLSSSRVDDEFASLAAASEKLRKKNDSRRVSRHETMRPSAVPKTRSFWDGYSTRPTSGAIFGNGQNGVCIDCHRKLFVLLSLLCITVIFILSFDEYRSREYNAEASIVTDCAYILVELCLLVISMRKSKWDVKFGLVSRMDYV